MTLEIRRVDGPGAQCGFQILPAMQALSASGNLETLKQQVKTRGGATRSAWSSVEWASRQRKAKNKNCRNTVVSRCALAELPFCLRV
jgi:hypothetical protein